MASKPAAKATKTAGKRKPNPALMKPLQPSKELGAVVGSAPLPRPQVVSKVWDYIKKNNLQNPTNKREIKADDFFKGLLTTALAEDEILTEVRVPALAPKTGAAYMKFPHPASRFAVVGVAAVLSVDGGKVGKASVGITGAGTKAVRAKGVEAAITGKGADAASIQAAAEKAAEGVDVQADLQGSVEYKSHLLRVFAKRAMEAAAAAVK